MEGAIIPEPKRPDVQLLANRIHFVDVFGRDLEYVHVQVDGFDLLRWSGFITLIGGQLADLDRFPNRRIIFWPRTTAQAKTHRTQKTKTGPEPGRRAGRQTAENRKQTSYVWSLVSGICIDRNVRGADHET